MKGRQLSEETIRACTYDKAFTRGEKYYQQGRVTHLQVDGLRYRAVVVGTERYEVQLNLTNLEGACTCYAFEGGLWCKHLVALGLMVSCGEPLAIEPPVKGQAVSRAGWTDVVALRAGLAEQPVKVLVRIIEKLADRDPDIWMVAERIINPPVMESPADILAAVKQALGPVKRAQSWRRQTEAMIQAREDIEEVSVQTPATETGVKGLLQAAQWIYKQLERIDDSDGELQEATGGLVARAIEIAGEQPEWARLLYEPLLEPTDLPMAEMILQLGTKQLRAECVARLDKHRYKRDERLAGLNQDQAELLLQSYFADRGDGRLLDLLKEQPVSEHRRTGLLIRYYTVRQEWAGLVRLAWPKRREHQVRQSLRAALEQLGAVDKLIELQIIETLEARDPLQALQRLEHVLRQHGQLEQLSAVTEQVLKNRGIQFEHKLALFLTLKRFDEAAILACQTLEKPPTRYGYQYSHTYAVVDEITQFTKGLTEAAPEHALTVWRALFSQELGRVVKSNQYTRFELFGQQLLKLDDRPWLQPFLNMLLERYPTRKKLVEICRRLDTIEA